MVILPQKVNDFFENIGNKDQSKRIEANQMRTLNQPHNPNVSTISHEQECLIQGYVTT